MKYFLTILLILFVQSTFAATYYISNAGNDANNGTSQATAWQTIDKVNTITLAAGDQVLFRRGDTFYGALKIYQAGTSSNRIIIGDYGSGAKPILEGRTQLNTWTTTADPNIMKCLLPSGGHLELLTVNDQPVGRGRWPNTGWRHYTSFIEDQSITDNTLSSTPNWTGAEIVMRKTQWTLDRDSIKNHSGSTFAFTPASTWESMSNGWGYFIQNSLATLDQLFEWYYDGTYVYMYFGANMPEKYNIKAATQDNIVYLNYNMDYITIKNLNLKGSDESAIEVMNSSFGTWVDSCDISLVGMNGFNSEWECPNITISNSTFRDIYNVGVLIAGASPNVHITNSTVDGINLIKGSGNYLASGNWDVVGDGIQMGNNNANQVVEYSTVTRTGHHGIGIMGRYDTVRNNRVSHIGQSRMDVGAIYVWNNTTSMKGALIANNIITDAEIDTSGNNKSDEQYGSAGVYIDFADSISIIGNSLSNITGYGIQINPSSAIQIHDNTVFNAKHSALMISGNGGENFNITRNKFISKTLPKAYYSLPYSSQYANSTVIDFTSTQSAFPNIGVIDSNYYARPLIGDNYIFNTKLNGDPWYGVHKTFSDWKTLSGRDSHSIGISPQSTTDTNDVRLEYNATTANKTISLDAKYVDITGTLYNGSITLLPYSSAVLIKSGSLDVAAPTVTVSADQTITGTSTTIIASGTPASGHTLSYHWTKISGAGIIQSPASISTLVSGLSGASIFRCTVTQDDGQTAYDEVTIAINLPPVIDTQNKLILRTRQTFSNN